MAADGKKRELQTGWGELGRPSILLYIFNEICEENVSFTCQTQMPQHMERCCTAIFLWLLNRRHLTSHSQHHHAELSSVTLDTVVDKVITGKSGWED
jgi:hypothetical protein